MESPPRRSRLKKLVKRTVIVLGVLVALLAGAAIYAIGPRNVIGMLRYDQRREGDLKVGDRAPDAQLLGLDGAQRVSLLGDRNGRPLVLVFGSFT